MSEGPDKAPFYICENIDDFNLHVLNGRLNKRGWVLQQHALARRTIFFTEHQTYFECGDGVRCETLTKMSNNLAAFLEDPNSPHIIMSTSQGEKIIRFQNLYKTYSGLAFTKAYDRPIAVDGIQSCLLKAFGTHGGYGIFAEKNDKGRGPGLLRRSLLWYRPPDKKELVRIKFPQDHAGVATVPSWSWMAYMGEVDFLQPPFGNINWMAIRSPCESQKKKTQCVVLGVENGNQVHIGRIR
ncbi:Serine/threonine-protein kinase par-4 [Pleurostoma richardsiae]|uniref:Serine/threonine-protein kinase par-4 n=1 Tax=Pleurostoma richardsiae TaxID=41990 RepID=A0AA38VKZ5_9PEZI|nr:Serine/threonine-protein kinase par-4 [Pleurostoma richardsiae]